MFKDRLKPNRIQQRMTHLAPDECHRIIMQALREWHAKPKTREGRFPAPYAGRTGLRRGGSLTGTLARPARHESRQDWPLLLESSRLCV